jgi:hypothetical protein
MEQQGSSLLFESESESNSESEGAEFFSDSFSTGSTPRLLSILLLLLLLLLCHDLSIRCYNQGGKPQVPVLPDRSRHKNGTYWYAQINMQGLRLLEGANRVPWKPYRE